MLGYCVKINNQEELKLVQEILFLKGYIWWGGDSLIPIRNHVGPYIFVNNIKKLEWSRIWITYYEDNYELLSFNEFLDKMEGELEIWI